MLRALIWDVDGTLAETERDGHRVAFNHAFEKEGLPWRWDVETYGDLLRVAGGFERLLSDMDRRADAPVGDAERTALARRIHDTKNAEYTRIVDSGQIVFRPGVLRLMDAGLQEGVAQAIATTTSRANVEALLRGAFGDDWPRRFEVLACAEDAPSKKPDPRVYHVALERLGFDASEVVALEDSPNGLDAARAAGIATVVVRSDYFRDAAFSGASAICDGLDERVVWANGEAPCVDLSVLRALVASSR